MQSIVKIRPATTRDIPDIGRLARKIWPVTYGDILTAAQLNYMLDYFYNPASLENQLVTLQHSFIMAILENEAVGFASWSPVDPGVYKLHKLYVDTSIQGKGIGKKMVDFILEKLESDRASALRLNVNRHNKARQFYEKLGFTIIGEEDVDIGNGVYQNDFIMEKKISFSA